MGPILLAGIISVLQLGGNVEPAGGDYVVVPFEVPSDTVEFEVAHVVSTEGAILDFGVWSPSGFRGWGGGLTEATTIGVDESTRGYLPGPIASGGGWQLVIGKAQIDASGARYDATITFRDEATQTPRPRAEWKPTVLGKGPRWYRGDLHVHSHESGDASASFDEIIALARMRHLDFVVLSDHNTVSQHALLAAKQAEVPDLLLVRGAEITTYAGHGGGLGISTYVDHRIGLDGRTADAMIRDVTAQGGVFIVNHPMLDLGSICIGCAWNHPDTPWDQVGAMEIQTGNYQLGISLFLQRVLDLWDSKLDQGMHIAAVGGSDDHRAGQDKSGTASPIGTPTTLVYADELSEPALVAAVRAGHTEVALRGPDDPLVELHTVGADPKGIGDTARGEHVKIDAHVVGGNGMWLSLVQDGDEVANVLVDQDDWTHRFAVTVRAAGSRVRAHLLDGNSPVVITSHVWLDYQADPAGCALDPRAGHHGGGVATLWVLGLLGVVVLRSRRRA